MEIAAVRSPGEPPVARFRVSHGLDPSVRLYELGWAVVRYLSAIVVDSKLQVAIQVSPWPPGDKRKLSRRRPSRDKNIPKRLLRRPKRHQRVAAYAIATSERGLLATQFSSTTTAEGAWGLPGGGIEKDEQPAEAVVREVMEETSQVLQIDRLADLQTDHWIGYSPRNVLEDFHALRLVYLGTVSDPGDPKVIDTGGTTAAARWMPLDAWPQVTWTSSARRLLTKHLPAPTGRVETRS